MGKEYLIGRHHRTWMVPHYRVPPPNHIPNDNNRMSLSHVTAKSYAVGAVLPQEPGNCLQCVCTAGTPDDVSPRVTCSSHNCPPLILPDLFDATGY